jgi:hypothetical protein
MPAPTIKIPRISNNELLPIEVTVVRDGTIVDDADLEFAAVDLDNEPADGDWVNAETVPVSGQSAIRIFTADAYVEQGVWVRIDGSVVLAPPEVCYLTRT